MTKETISTFLPIVNIGIRAKSVKSKGANPEIKLLKISVLFLQPIRYHVIDSLQIWMSITWDVWPLVPLLVQCVVCLQFTPTVFSLGSHAGVFRDEKRAPLKTPAREAIFSYNWVVFLKSASSFDFEQWKKRSQRMKEKSSSTVGLFVILDNVSSSRSRSPEKWRLVHNQSRSVQTYRSFNQLISNHLRDTVMTTS